MKRSIYRYVLPFIGYLALRAIAATYRLRFENQEYEQDIFDRGMTPIYCSWHQRFFAGITEFPRRHRIAIMISKSRDGDMVARIAELCGWRAVRGSSSRGGKEALDELRVAVGEGFAIGHIVDGPRGPAGIVKPGLVSLAQHTGMPIVPAIVSAKKKWVFGSWDRFWVPKPFTRVIIRFDRPIMVPPKLGKQEFERLRKNIEQTCHDRYREADDIWAGRSEKA